MRCAVVVDDVVTNVILAATLDDAQSTAELENGEAVEETEATGPAGPGFTYDGQVFAPPPADGF